MFGRPPEVIPDHIADRQFWSKIRQMAFFVTVTVAISQFVATVNRKAGQELLFGR